MDDFAALGVCLALASDLGNRSALRIRYPGGENVALALAMLPGLSSLADQNLPVCENPVAAEKAVITRRKTFFIFV